MTNILIVAEQSAGSLRKATLHAITAGREIAQRTGGKLYAALLGKDAGPAAEKLAAHGAEVLFADSPALEPYLTERHASVVARIARDLDVTFVGAAATARGKDLIPRVAAKLGAAAATDVLGFSGDGAAVTFLRPVWAGNLIAEVELSTSIAAFTVRPTQFVPAGEAPGGKVRPVPVDTDLSPARSRFVSFQEVKSGRPDLSEARVVVAGGRGTKGDFREIEALADLLGAAVGATRAAVDAGWVPNDWQIGQTGKVVAPELYIGAGISGAIQHLSGMKGAKVIVAINKDADAPVFQLADYGLVADLFEALPELRARIRGGR